MMIFLVMMRVILIAIDHMDRQTSVPTTPPLSSSITPSCLYSTLHPYIFAFSLTHFHIVELP